MKMIKKFIFTDHIHILVSSIINLNFDPKAHHTGKGLIKHGSLDAFEVCIFFISI